MNPFLLLFPLLLPAAQSACINCGGADKTSAKRLKMPNKSVFTRLAGIELMEIFEITNQINHEVCAQQCDAHAECAVFEFNLPNKLCVLASEYARLSDDLTKGAFETIVFVKVRGKFTKALPKGKETCLDKSEYEDYVKHEVDKWLNPTPKKSTSAHGSSSDSPTTTVPHTTQTSDPTPTVSTHDNTTTTGNGGEEATTGSNGPTTASGTTTTAGGTTGAESTKITTTTSSTASDTSSIVSLSSETATSSAATSPQATTSTTTAVPSTYTSQGHSSTSTTTHAATTSTSTTTASTSTAAAPTVSTTDPLVSRSASSTADSSDTSVSHSSTTVTKKDPNGTRSTQSSTQSTMDQGSTTTEDPSTSTEITTPEEDTSTSESTQSSVEPSSTTRVDKDSTTTQPEVTTPPVPKDPVGQWRLRSVQYGKYLRANSKGSVDVAEARNDYEQWEIKQNGTKFTLMSMSNTGRLVYLRASIDPLTKTSSKSSQHVPMAVNLTDVSRSFEQWGATMNDDDRSWTFVSHNSRWLSSNGTAIYTIEPPKQPSPSERFVLEKL